MSINYIILEVPKKANDRVGIDFYFPGRSDDVNIKLNLSMKSYI